MYVGEFQKRGLSHAHILLWVHFSSKCMTPKVVDKIIYAKILDLYKDPTG